MDLYEVMLRTTERTENGESSLSSLHGVARALPTHVVYTRDASGLSSLYVNNELHSRETVGGDLDNWEADYPFVMGNEATGGYPWLGRLYLVAIYCRALDSSDIWQNYVTGLREIYQSPY